MYTVVSLISSRVINQYKKLNLLVLFLLNVSYLNSGNGKLATWGCIVGFVVMMSLDVGLG